jgi:site-specific recombinase XerD
VAATQPKIFAEFREWLKAGGYSNSAINQYSVAVRLGLSFLDRPFSEIDPEADLNRVRKYLIERPLKDSTLATYHKGLTKLAQYLRYRGNLPEPERTIEWEKYLASFTPDLAADIRAYVVHRSRGWQAEQQYQATLNLRNHLAKTLRGLFCYTQTMDLSEITPIVWFDYVEHRLQAGIQPRTLNRELYDLQDFLRFVQELERPICERILTIEPLHTAASLPRDVPLNQLRQLLRQIQTEVTTTKTRQALLDQAWILLMLHCGLRTGEVRSLRLADLDLANRQLRIASGKGNAERIVFLSQTVVEAFKDYLTVRGPAARDKVFIYRHQPLRRGYCGQQLRINGKHCGLRVTPHQLRYSCASLLLNAGMPILTVQHILGHRWVETTLGYARLYDRTVAQDYERAMCGVEKITDYFTIPPIRERHRRRHYW